MAIAPSKLGRLVSEHWHADDVLVQRLRELGLVAEDASDSDLRSTFRMARDEDSAWDPDDRAFNSPEERVRVFLAPFLSGKGRAWAEPLRSLDLPDDDGRSQTQTRAPWRNRPTALGALWRGHVFLFDKERQPAAFGNREGVLLLVVFTAMEAVRLLRRRFELAVLPLWLEVPIYLVMVLAATRYIAQVPLRQIGFIRWLQWNRTERFYFLQVVVLVNVVFPVLLASKLRGALAEPSALWTMFAPYFVYGFYQEVLYRGLLQTELVRRWGPVAGILISNLLFTFGPLHYYYFASPASLAVPMFAGIFAIGLLFAVVYHRTGNLWIVATMHAFGNAYAAGALGHLR